MHYTFLVPQDYLREPDASLQPTRFSPVPKQNNRYITFLRNCEMEIELREPHRESRITIRVASEDVNLPWGALYEAAYVFLYARHINPLRDNGRRWFQKLRWVVDESFTARPDLHPTDISPVDQGLPLLLRGHTFTGYRLSTTVFFSEREAIDLFTAELRLHLKKFPFAKPEPVMPKKRKR